MYTTFYGRLIVAWTFRKIFSVIFNIYLNLAQLNDKPVINKFGCSITVHSGWVSRLSAAGHTIVPNLQTIDSMNKHLTQIRDS